MSGAKLTRPPVEAKTVVGDWDRNGDLRITLVGVKIGDAPTARWIADRVNEALAAARAA